MCYFPDGQVLKYWCSLRFLGFFGFLKPKILKLHFPDGLCQAPAQTMTPNTENSEGPSLLMEKMGVSDVLQDPWSYFDGVSFVKNLIPFIFLFHPNFSEAGNSDRHQGAATMRVSKVLNAIHPARWFPSRYVALLSFETRWSSLCPPNPSWS